MKVARIRLIVAGILLFGWLGWLGYLAATKTKPVVVSRSQVMASTHFVLADITVDPSTGQPNREVQIREDLRPKGEPLSGTIRVGNLAEARVGGAENFTAEGPYLLMLTKSLSGFELTWPPRSPGYDGPARPQPWVYLWNAPDVQDQFESLVPKQ